MSTVPKSILVPFPLQSDLFFLFFQVTRRAVPNRRNVMNGLAAVAVQEQAGEDEQEQELLTVILDGRHLHLAVLTDDT